MQESTSKSEQISILYQDPHVIVAEKPIGMPTQPDKAGINDMLSSLSAQSKVKNLTLVNRLDRPVGGIVIFAKNHEAASNLNSQLANNKMDKKYLAVVCGFVPDHGQEQVELRHFLIHNERLNISKAVPANTKNSKEAVLWYKKIASIKEEEGRDLSLVEVELVTGRHHQIRVQFSASQFPIWGDTKYNQSFARKHNVALALWSYALSFKHPVSNKKMHFQLDPRENYPFNLFGSAKNMPTSHKGE